MDIIYPVEGIQTLIGGTQVTYSCIFQGGTTLSSASVVAYQGSTLVTSTLFPSGSCTISGNSVQLPQLVIPADPARNYVIVLTVTVDGNVDVRKIMIDCEKPKDRM